MKKTMRMISVFLALMVSAVQFAGCGQQTATTSSGSSETTETSSAETTQSEVSESQAAEEQLEEANLVYYCVGTPQADLATVNDAINQNLKEKINATVEIKLIDWGSYDSKMALVMSGGEEYDMCFTSSWTNNYYQNVAKGAYLEISELLDTYAPQTKAIAPQRFWDAITVNGQLYGTINFQQAAAGFGFRVQQELADKYNFDWSSTEKLADVEPFLAAIKENEPDLIPFGYNKIVDPFTKGPIAWGFDAIGDIFAPGWVRLDDETLTVVNQYDTPEFMEYCTLMHDWYQKGYIRADAATLSDVTADVQAGKYALEYEQIDIGTKDFEAAGLEFAGRLMTPAGIPSYDHKFVEPILTNEKASATMTAISATSKNPERAMMLIELLNTDKELYNLFCFGLEGVHYNRTTDDGIEVNAEAGYAPWSAWEFGNMGNMLIATGTWPEGGEKLREDGLSVANGLWYDLNQNVEGSPLLGFVFDYEPVKSEIANCQAVFDELYYSISCGSVDPEVYIPQFNQQLETAGMSRILAEKQAQLDAWKASK